MSEEGNCPQSTSSEKKQAVDDMDLSSPVEKLPEVERPAMPENPAMEIKDSEEKAKEGLRKKGELIPQISTTDTLEQSTGNQSRNNTRNSSEPDVKRTEEKPIEAPDSEKVTKVRTPDNTLSDAKSPEPLEDSPMEFQDNYFGKEKSELCSPSKKSTINLNISAAVAPEQSTRTQSPRSVSNESMDSSEEKLIETPNEGNPVGASSGKQPVDPLVPIPDKPAEEVQIAGPCPGSNEQDLMNTGAQGVDAGPEKPADPIHVCTDTCIHGGARPKIRPSTAATSEDQPSDMQMREEVNGYAERLEKNVLRGYNSFGKDMQADWTRNTEFARHLSERFADRMGHGSFVQAPSTSDCASYFIQLNRMFTNLSLDETIKEQEPCPVKGPNQPEDIHHQESTINLNHVPEPSRPVDVDEILATALQKWIISAAEPGAQVIENPAPRHEERADTPPLEEEPEPEPERRIEIAFPRVFRVIDVNDHEANYFYLHEVNYLWRNFMLIAFESELYHDDELLEVVISQFERDGISDDEFYELYHNARKNFLSTDEGVGDEATREWRIEQRIIQVIEAYGYMVLAMLYIRMFLSRNPDYFGETDESTTEDSGECVNTQSGPMFPIVRLREHMKVEVPFPEERESSTATDSTGTSIPLPYEESSEEKRRTPVTILLPLDQLPRREDTSSEVYLFNECESSESTSSRDRMRRAVLLKNTSQDSTSNDASSIPFDEEEDTTPQLTNGQLLNLLIQAVFVVARDIKSVAEEVVRKRDEEDSQDVATCKTEESALPSSSSSEEISISCTLSSSSGEGIGQRYQIVATKKVQSDEMRGSEVKVCADPSSGKLSEESSNQEGLVEMGDSSKGEGEIGLKYQGDAEAPSETQVEEASTMPEVSTAVSECAKTSSCEQQDDFTDGSNEVAGAIEVGSKAGGDKTKSSSEGCDHSEEKDAVSEVNPKDEKADEEKEGLLEKDQLKKSDLQDQDGEDHSMAGQSKKRKDFSDSEDESESLAKRGHMEK